jgi:hypothetical protein
VVLCGWGNVEERPRLRSKAIPRAGSSQMSDWYGGIALRWSQSHRASTGIPLCNGHNRLEASTGVPLCNGHNRLETGSYPIIEYDVVWQALP